MADAIVEKGNDFEKGIISWCLQNYPPLNYSDHSDWIIITYEELITNPEILINYLSKSLDLVDTDKMLKNIYRPSRVIYKSDQTTKQFFKQNAIHRDRAWLIEKWKDKITKEQEEIAFDILNVFKIDAYSYGRYLPTETYLISHRKPTAMSIS